MAEFKTVTKDGVNSVYDLKGDLIAISSNPQYRKPEFVTDDPLSAFGRGAYSFPHDWWVAIHWVNGLNGLYGPGMKQQAISIGRSLDTMFDLVKSAAPYTFRVTYVALNYIFANRETGYAAIDEVLARIDRKQFLNGSTNVIAGIAGRKAGHMFTNYASTGGRAGARRLPKNSKLRKGGSIGNWSLAAMGSLLGLAVKTRAVNVSSIDMLLAMMTGQVQNASGQIYTDLYREILRTEMEFDEKEEKAFYKILDDAKMFFDMKRREAVSAR